MAGQDAELAAVLAAELRGAVLTDTVADARDVALARASSSRASCRRICFWNWTGLIVVTAWKLREGAHAHASQLRQLLHPEGLGVVVADPSHCLADAGKAAVGEADLADGGALPASDQPPQDLPLDKRCEDLNVAGPAD